MSNISIYSVVGTELKWDLNSTLHFLSQVFIKGYQKAIYKERTSTSDIVNRNLAQMFKMKFFFSPL